MGNPQREVDHHLSEDLPVDVLPCSNGEFLPPDPSQDQLNIMRLADQETEKARRRFNMPRREFVRTAAAMAIGTWAVGQVNGGKFGTFAHASENQADPTAACNLEWPGAQMGNEPGEFIFDVQSHHVEPDDTWRITNPAFHLFFAAIWPQAGPLGGTPNIDQDGDVRGFGEGGEIDPIENLSRFHYLKELFLDSSTNMTVLSAVPAAPDDQPLGIDRAAYTVDVVNSLAGDTPRSVMHAFVMPNRGSGGTMSTVAGQDPAFMAEEFELMERNLELYGTGRIRGWKVYTPWGDVPGASGWYLDDDIGMKFLNKVRECGDKFGANKLIACHKGFALPGFDQRTASPRDVGPAARQNADITFIVYHSGFDGETQTAYPGDDNVNSADRGVDCFVKSLRENGLDADHHVPAGLEHGNSPNVYGEIGSTMRDVMDNPDEMSHLLGKLVKYVGAQRVVWGTDSLWFGSPQSEIVRLRAFRMTDEAKALYNLPYGLDGDRFDPRRNALDGVSYMTDNPAVAGWPTDGRAHPERTIRNGIFGRNGAVAYGINPDADRLAIACDEVQTMRDSYLLGSGTPTERRPMASNRLYGLRTPREVMADLLSKPWAP